jgi:outer membrane protein TolC
MRKGALIPTILALGWLAASATPASGQASYRLTLKEAIQKGLQNNLRVLVAGTVVEEAEGARQRRLARLLPRVRGESLANVQTRNLRAFGIDVPGAPDIVGPFSNYDFRAYVDQPLLDLPNYHRWKASGQHERATRLEYQDVRDLIIRQVATLYLHAQATTARVEAAASRVATAEELHRLARDQREAGVATGVDVLRAEVELANERQRLLEARNNTEQALLALARAIGMDLGAPLELAEPLDFKPVTTPEVNAAVVSALDNRPDYLSLQVRQQALQEEEKSNRTRRLPRLSFSGHYGAIGITPSELRSTGVVQGTVSIELFDWDRQGERMEIDSRRQRLEHQMADLRQGIEEEIRDALLRLDSAAQEVQVAQQGRTLAQRELELVRERFQAGVTSNIEVTSAQEALARAQENHIVALTRYADAKMALARALGATEEIYEHYLGIR